VVISDGQSRKIGGSRQSARCVSNSFDDHRTDCYRGRPSTLKIIVVCREGILELPLLRILSLVVKKKTHLSIYLE